MDKLEFKLKKIQFALFPKNLNLSDKLKIATDIKIKTAALFSGDPTILPIPLEAPVEIPRIILKSEDGIYSCNISSSRIDFFYQNNLSANFDTFIKKYLSDAKLIYSYFVDELKVTVGRIGFVVDFVADLTESSNKILQKILQEDYYFSASEKIKNISLVFSEKDVANSIWEINRLIKIESLRNASDPDNDKSIHLQYDINTAQEKVNEYNLTITNIATLLDNMSSEITTEKLNKFLGIKNVN